jgi:hypothetical protein
VLLLACGGSAEPATTTTPAAAPATDDAAEPAAGGVDGVDAVAECVRVFTRQRDCTAEFIPALVSWRVELDNPAGIAARDAAEGRDALVAVALEEWAEDSTDEALAATCAEIVASIPPEQLTGMLATATGCLEHAECGAFVDCMAPLHRQQLAAPH